MRLLCFLLFVMLFVSCGNGDSQPFGNGGDEKWSKEADFEEKVSTYEDEHRDVWQKPQVVLDLINDINRQTVVDLGAGTGYFAFRLVKKGADVIAVDIDPEMIQFMQYNKSKLPPHLQAKFDIRLAETDDPNLGKNEADIVLLVNTYVYLENRIAYLKTLKPAFKEEGKLIIIEFKFQNTAVGPPMEERMAVPKVKSELIKAGYKISIIDSTTLDFQYILTAKPQN